jgi:hypothetical protein
MFQIKHATAKIVISLYIHIIIIHFGLTLVEKKPVKKNITMYKKFGAAVKCLKTISNVQIIVFELKYFDGLLSDLFF